MPRPLTKGQRDVLRRADKDGKVADAGRGCKQVMNGLVDRGLIENLRCAMFGETGYIASLTAAGRAMSEDLRRG